MLPAPGVTKTEPFTSDRIMDKDKAELYSTLYRMIKRAARRIPGKDVEAVRSALKSSEYGRYILGPQPVSPDFSASGIADQLEALIEIFAKNAPRVMQPGDRQNWSCCRSRPRLRYPCLRHGSIRSIRLA